ncbi:MAG: Ig-like domain-containing protein, partial [Dokdonella sp.]
MSVSATEVAVDISVTSAAPLFARRVSVIGTASRIDAPQLLEIRDAPPQLTALSPTYLIRDGSSQTLALQGVHLGQATAVRVVPDTDLIIEDFTVVDDGSAQVTLRTTGQASLGTRVVIVSSPSGESATDPTPANTFRVAAPSQILTPFVSAAVGVEKGAIVNPASLGLLHAPLVGIAKGAVASALSPGRIERGRSSRINVQGQMLDSVNAVSVDAAEGVEISGLAIAPDGLSLSFDINVAVDASIGFRRVVLSTGSTTIAFAPLRAALLEISSNVIVGPIASPDTYSATTNTPLAVSALDGVLVNDQDPGGGTLYAVLRRLPAQGTLSLSADGSFVYTPNPDFIGTDRFEYSAGSGALVGASTTVSLSVAQIHDAVDDAYVTDDNRTLDVPAELGLLANDVIGPGSTPSIEIEMLPGLGQLTLAANGGFRYVPNGTSGIDRFRYRLVADGIRSAPAEVSIVVNDINEPPIAIDDLYVVESGDSLVVTAPGVIANDSDPDGDSLSAQILSDPLVGALAFNASGAFNFTPSAGFVGEVNFVYEIRDPSGLRAQATVRVNVNNSLAPLPDAYSL